MGRIILNGAQVDVGFATNLSLMDSLEGRSRRGDVCQVILHHDACISALRCHAVLKAKGYSTHFCIDNDGTVFQFADPATREAWHALGQEMIGGVAVPTTFNRNSVGIDISNAVLPSFADRCTPPRERAVLPVQGRPYDGLLPYPVQVDACLSLLRVLRAHFPAITADHRDDLRWNGDISNKTPGIWGHGQVNKGKVDPFGFPFGRLVEVAA